MSVASRIQFIWSRKMAYKNEVNEDVISKSKDHLIK